MTVTVNLTPIFYILAAYYIIGLILYVPLVYWSSKFISPRRTGRDVWKGARAKHIVLQTLIGAGICWPLIVWDCLRNERKYGIFKDGK